MGKPSLIILTMVAMATLLSACGTAASDTGTSSHAGHAGHGAGATHAPETKTVGRVTLQMRDVMATPVQAAPDGSLPASSCTTSPPAPGNATLCSLEGRRYLVGEPTDVCCVESAHLMPGSGDPQVADWAVMVTLTSSGAKDFTRITKAADKRGGHVALTMGADVLVAPTVPSDIENRQMSIGSMTETQAKAFFAQMTGSAR